MSFEPKNGRCLCERCGHVWWTSFTYSLQKYVEPRSCAKCKSKGWNKPRVYGGKYLDGSAAMAKRYKATGRKAANLRPEKIRAEKIADLKTQLRIAQNEYNKIQDQLADPEHWKYDRQALGYYFKNYSQIIKDLKNEIEELEAYDSIYKEIATIAQKSA